MRFPEIWKWTTFWNFENSLPTEEIEKLHYLALGNLKIFSKKIIMSFRNVNISLDHKKFCKLQYLKFKKV